MKDRVAIIMMLAALVGSSLLLAQSSRSADVQFKAAQHKEEVEGDLRGAIELYRQVVEMAGSNRALAAQALLCEADLHQKLNDGEASRVYQQIIREFSDQPEVVALARQRELGGSPPAQSRPAGTGIDAIQLWSGGDIEGDASMSSDGRYLVYSSWAANGNLVVKNLATGDVRPITQAAAVRVNGTPQPWSPVFSPDGTRIAYAWYEGLGTSLRTSLRIVDRDGSNLRVLAPDADVDIVYAWSPDSRRIALNLYNSGQSRLALASVADGSIVPLRSTEWRKTTGASFSPDGRFLVYSLPSADRVPESGGVFMLAVDGSTNEKIADGDSPAFTPDGRSVVFFSDRSGTSDLWMFPVTEGHAAGVPTVLRRGIGTKNHGFLADGSLFYEMRNAGRDVLVGTFDSLTRAGQESATLTDRYAGSNGAGVWSPDGRQVAFVRRHVYVARADGPQAALVIRTVATGSERIVPVTLDSALLVQNQGLRWFPDGQSLLIRERSAGRIAFKRIAIATGTSEILFDAPDREWGRWFDLSPDGQSVIYTHRATSTEFAVFKHDLSTGQELELHRTGGMLAMSPDGTRLAIGRESTTMLIMPTADGPPTELHTGRETIEPLAWTRDGQYVLGAYEDENATHLRAIPVTGGAPINLGVSAEDIHTVSVSPIDGSILVSVSRPSHELWVIRNLLRR